MEPNYWGSQAPCWIIGEALPGSYSTAPSHTEIPYSANTSAAHLCCVVILGETLKKQKKKCQASIMDLHHGVKSMNTR